VREAGDFAVALAAGDVGLEHNEQARAALDWLQENRYGELLFMWPWGSPIGKVTVYDAFKKACSAARVADFRFHDLRHSFASHLVMAGVDLVTVKELLGHKTINMTNRYTHLAQEHKAQAVAKLSERMQADKTAAEGQAGTVSRGIEGGPSTQLRTGNQRCFAAELGTKPEHFFSEERPRAGNRQRFQAQFGGGERIRTAASRFCRPLP